MEYTNFQSEPQDESSRRIRTFFRDIEKMARLSGNTALLMKLDRIPCLLLGSSNKVPEGCVDIANGHAISALEQITEAFSAEVSGAGSAIR